MGETAMRGLAFEDILAALAATPLCSDDLARLRTWLASIAHPGECQALIEQAAGIPPCPRCHCRQVHRCGHASGLQRYRCCRCGRSYNALSGTPLARLRLKEKWLPTCSVCWNRAPCALPRNSSRSTGPRAFAGAIAS